MDSGGHLHQEVLGLVRCKGDLGGHLSLCESLGWYDDWGLRRTSLSLGVLGLVQRTEDLGGHLFLWESLGRYDEPKTQEDVSFRRSLG